VSEAKDAAKDTAPRKGKSKLLLGAFVLALLAGGGGFYAVYSGLLVLPFLGQPKAGPGTSEPGKGGEGYAEASNPFAAGAYVELDPLIVSLGPQSPSSLLKVTLTVEVRPGREAEVEAVRPRVVDILNGFLRAVDEREFELPRSMERLRVQMLRRVRLVTPEGAVSDLLIQDFVLN
jgi:flagellar protein FliL